MMRKQNVSSSVAASSIFRRNVGKLLAVNRLIGKKGIMLQKNFFILIIIDDDEGLSGNFVQIMTQINEVKGTTQLLHLVHH